MTARLPAPRGWHAQPVPAGVPPEPATEALLRLLLDTLANASEIVQLGNGFALVVELTPEMLDVVACAGALVEGLEDDGTGDEEEDPAEDAGEAEHLYEDDERDDAGAPRPSPSVRWAQSGSR